jgi:hypothetical protein
MLKYIENLQTLSHLRHLTTIWAFQFSNNMSVPFQVCAQFTTNSWRRAFTHVARILWQKQKQVPKISKSVKKDYTFYEVLMSVIFYAFYFWLFLYKACRSKYNPTSHFLGAFRSKRRISLYRLGTELNLCCFLLFWSSLPTLAPRLQFCA